MCHSLVFLRRRANLRWRQPKDEADEKAAAFADGDRTNPFAVNQRLLLPWDKIEAKGMPHLRAHCMHFSNLPPQVY